MLRNLGERDCFEPIDIQHSNRRHCEIHRLIYRRNQEIGTIKLIKFSQVVQVRDFGSSART